MGPNIGEVAVRLREGTRLEMTRKPIRKAAMCFAG
jgi:hypothetical protein